MPKRPESCLGAQIQPQTCPGVSRPSQASDHTPRRQNSMPRRQNQCLGVGNLIQHLRLTRVTLGASFE
ncbi:hypothetical protein PIB30_072889, partial [Stylosanthes scabra]|nr:hypothetical protein [Stylosanthes scabra]